MESSGPDVRSGKMRALAAASSNPGITRSHVWVDVIFAPFGSHMVMP